MHVVRSTLHDHTQTAGEACYDFVNEIADILLNDDSDRSGCLRGSSVLDLSRLIVFELGQCFHYHVCAWRF